MWYTCWVLCWTSTSQRLGSTFSNGVYVRFIESSDMYEKILVISKWINWENWSFHRHQWIRLGGIFRCCFAKRKPQLKLRWHILLVKVFFDLPWGTNSLSFRCRIVLQHSIQQRQFKQTTFLFSPESQTVSQHAKLASDFPVYKL